MRFTNLIYISAISLPFFVCADMISKIQVGKMKKMLEDDNAPDEYFEPIRKWENQNLVIRIFTNPCWSKKD